jgi:hypothetical protein
MSDTGDGLEAGAANGRGHDGKVTDFVLVDDIGNSFNAEVELHKDKLTLKVRGLEHSVKEIRYCYAQTNSGALIYNSTGLPMSPGIYRL